MATKREREDEDRKSRLLALVGAGASHFRENQGLKDEAATPPEPMPELGAAVIEAPKPKAAKSKPSPIPLRDPWMGKAEEPPLGPEPEDPAKYLVRRRRSLREDPEWIGTTLYLRKETHAALQEFCRGAGLDMSRVVQYCVSLQMDERQRSPVLSQLLGE